jgi:hypothetical protein
MQLLSRRMGPRVRGDDHYFHAGHDGREIEKRAYASPSVSNIAALMASGAVLPAQTTN